MQDKVKQAPEQEERFIKVISGMNADREKLKLLPINPETRLPEFKITLDGTEYTDKTEAGKALEKVVFGKLVAQMDKSVEIGEFHGFRLSVYMDSFTKNIRASLKSEAQYSVEFGVSYPSNLKRLENTLYRIDQRITEANDKLSQLRLDAAEAKKILDTPFAQEQELKDKSERLETLTEELNATAMEAKMNGGDRERTYYFDIAKMKKESAKSGKNVNKKDRVKNKTESVVYHNKLQESL